MLFLFTVLRKKGVSSIPRKGKDMFTTTLITSVNKLRSQVTPTIISGDYHDLLCAYKISAFGVTGDGC